MENRVKQIVNKAINEAYRLETNLLGDEAKKELDEFLLAIVNMNSIALDTTDGFDVVKFEIFKDTGNDDLGQHLKLSFLSKLFTQLMSLSIEEDLYVLDIAEEIIIKQKEIFNKTNILDTELKQLLELDEKDEEIDDIFKIIFLINNYLDAEKIIRKG